jgi:type IV pilus assembly protein PilN
MPRLNLLPWRETLKREREVRFGAITGISLVLTGLVVLGVHIYMEQLILYQESRNAYIQDEIKKVESQIKEIEELEKKKQRLIDRMKVIQELESNRPKIVHLFDEVVKRIPDGVYFTKLVQTGENIVLEGVAQSDARVSSLMRNIEASEWLTEPRIQIIESKEEKNDKKKTKRSVSMFTLKLKQTAPKAQEE